MSTPVVMPQMGESIAEGTIVRWIKKVGDSVDRDEPLFEISTDKVDAEIPSPAAGVLTAIQVKEGETVPVNSVVATIGTAGEAAQGAQVHRVRKVHRERTVRRNQRQADATGTPGATVAAPEAPDSEDSLDPSPSADLSAVASAKAEAAEGREGGPQPSPADLSAEVFAAGPQDRQGTQRRYLADQRIRHRRSRHQAGHPWLYRQWWRYIARRRPSIRAPRARRVNRSLRTSPHQLRAGLVIKSSPMSVMRKKIAEHMIVSRRTSAHVYSVFEVNYSRVDQIRKEKKDEYERMGAKLTFTSFIAKVVVDCLRRHKVVNASIDGDNIIYRSDINLGIAVALDNGLIVPVVKGAGEKNILGLSKAIQDVADRARAKKLNPEEVHGGTFTITNPGNFGAQFGLPIINQPQVAILGVGTIEKRPVVIDDLIGIRLMGFLTLGYDHRLIDGAVADQFMADVKKGIEQFDPSQV